nr:AAA family ATPase [Kineosphaera limosa]
MGRALGGAIRSVIEGKEEVVDRALTVLLAGGHLLLEDVPGVGKTTLAKALAKAVDARMRRIQFTPDLLPSDITGISVFDAEQRRFEFRAGAIFANIVVCDEINRASPKAQSAVLESMEEAQVTVDGNTYALPSPFLVIATQNPLEMEGTYPLPEAQRDRFMARVAVGYPHPEAELAMLASHGSHNPLEDVRAVTDGATVVAAQETVRRVYAAHALQRYVVDLVAATRAAPTLRLGASPRASLHLLRAARARAALTGRDYVLPEDVQALFVPVLEHRVLLSGEARLARLAVTDVLWDVLESVPLPGRPGATRAGHEGADRLSPDHGPLDPSTAGRR